jgi:hypothetical protein
MQTPWIDFLAGLEALVIALRDHDRLVAEAFAVDDKVKIRCPACTRVFREKAARVRDGSQLNCHNCNRLVTLTKETEDPFLRRALKAAREIRALLDAKVVEKYTTATLPKTNAP